MIECWPWIVSIYMAVITLSTVGFREVAPLSPAGRIFTVTLIAVGCDDVPEGATYSGDPIEVFGTLDLDSSDMIVSYRVPFRAMDS